MTRKPNKEGEREASLLWDEGLVRRAPRVTISPLGGKKVGRGEKTETKPRVDTGRQLSHLKDRRGGVPQKPQCTKKKQQPLRHHKKKKDRSSASKKKLSTTASERKRGLGGNLNDLARGKKKGKKAPRPAKYKRSPEKTTSPAAWKGKNKRHPTRQCKRKGEKILTG